MREELEDVLREIRAGARRQGFAEEVLGEVGGWPLLALTRETPGRASVYLSSGIHGDEPAGVWAMAEILRAGLLDERFSWRLCPVLNPTGLARGTRENAEGHDLNRDYLQARSPEVRWHRKWLERLGPPGLFLSLHEDWEATGFYYYEIALHDQPTCYEGVRQAAESVLPMEPESEIDGHGTRAPGWIYHPARPDRKDAWPEAIFLSHQGCPLSYTLETPSGRALSQRVRCHLEVVRFLLADLAGRPGAP